MNNKNRIGKLGGGRCADHPHLHSTLGAFKNAPPTIHSMFIIFYGRYFNIVNLKLF